MSEGKVIERGVVGGKPYRVWQAHRTGKKIVYWGQRTRKSGGTGQVRSLRWLRKAQSTEVSDE